MGSLYTKCKKCDFKITKENKWRSTGELYLDR
jgi:hypothetical protein